MKYSSFYPKNICILLEFISKVPIGHSQSTPYLFPLHYNKIYKYNISINELCLCTL